MERRSALKVAGLGLLGVVAAACGSTAAKALRTSTSTSSGSPSTTSGPSSTSTTAPTSTTAGPTTTAPASTTAPPTTAVTVAWPVVARSADLPPGAARTYQFGAPSRFAGTPYQGIVYRSASGELTSHALYCTHAGCQVNPQPVDGQLLCPCHGSIFNLADGAVIAGPAPAPLPAERVTESDGAIRWVGGL
jgi:Rieske Fe-S protein